MPAELCTQLIWRFEVIVEKSDDRGTDEEQQLDCANIDNLHQTGY